MEFADYKPGETALRHLPEVDFVAIIGPTAAGKTTLLENAIARNPSINLMVATTSRLPRPGELDGTDYHFLSEKEMRDRIQHREFVSVAPRVLGDIYATAPEDYSRTGIAAAAIIADAMPGFLSLPFQRIRQIFVLPPSWEAWQERINAHNFTPEQIAKRLHEAGRSLAYAVEGGKNIFFVLNEDVEQATTDLLQVMIDDTPILSWNTGRERARMLLESLKDNSD